MLELYNPYTCTFFTPSRELGFSLHEMYEVSGLPMEEMPYEKYIPGTEEFCSEESGSTSLRNLLGVIVPLLHLCPDYWIESWGIKQMSWQVTCFKIWETRRFLFLI